MKKAFTLIELIVVIGILGILMATLAVSMSGGSESGRATQCLANMKNLASGVQSYMGATRRYPLAGSVETITIKWGGGKDVKEIYGEVPGWISWNSRGAYCGSPSSHRASESWFSSAYSTDVNVRDYAITNGALWSAVSATRSCYTCPNHARDVKGLQMDPNWSYVMNAWFRWDTSLGGDALYFDTDPRIRTETAFRGDKLLLFAELQWTDYVGSSPDTSSSSGIANDCVLQYKDCAKGIGEAESIGFNHKSGRDTVAHVVFLDGHTDKIVWNANEDVKELTKWLCTGTDIQYNPSSKRWEKAR